MLFRSRPRMKATMTITVRRIAAGIAMVLAISGGPTAAQDARDADQSTTSVLVGRGLLDGMTFVGKIGPEDDQDLDDKLHFAAGQFWSTNCVACGYRPGPYRSHRVGDVVRFHGALQSADGGRFEYDGHVVGAQVDVRINWTQQRWYGDIERRLAFAGALSPAAPVPSVPALSAAGSSDASATCRRL